jgi:hypothetical protein
MSTVIPTPTTSPLAMRYRIGQVFNFRVVCISVVHGPLGHGVTFMAEMYSGLSEMELCPTPGITVKVASDSGKCL